MRLADTRFSARRLRKMSVLNYLLPNTRLVKDVTYDFPAGGATFGDNGKKRNDAVWGRKFARMPSVAPGDKPMFSMAVGRRIIHAIRSRRLSEKYVAVSINAEMDYQSGRAGI